MGCVQRVVDMGCVQRPSLEVGLKVRIKEWVFGQKE